MGSLANKANPGIGLDPSIPGWAEQVGTTMNNFLIGKLNNTGTAVLGSGAGSITISDARCGPESVVSLMGTGATPVGHWSVQTRTNGAFTVTRASTTGTCTIAYTLLG